MVERTHQSCCRGSSGSHAYERLRTVLQQEARCYCFCLFVWRCFRTTIITRKRISYELSKDVTTQAGYSVVEDDRYSHEELQRGASSAPQQNPWNSRCAQILLASIENCSGGDTKVVSQLQRMRESIRLSFEIQLSRSSCASLTRSNFTHRMSSGVQRPL